MKLASMINKASEVCNIKESVVTYTMVIVCIDKILLEHSKKELPYVLKIIKYFFGFYEIFILFY